MWGVKDQVPEIAGMASGRMPISWVGKREAGDRVYNEVMKYADNDELGQWRR
jgi:hypothetical protein